MRLERVFALLLAIKIFSSLKHRNVFHRGCTEQTDRQKGQFGDSHIK